MRKSDEDSKGPARAVRVLVVDDNVDAAETLAVLMRANGHEVRTAHDGHAGLQAALDYLPHAVLLDIGLPGMDGHEVAQRMRQLPRLQNVVLIALTGYGHDEDREIAREAGFDHHLVKPADFGEVMMILAAIAPGE